MGKISYKPAEIHISVKQPITSDTRVIQVSHYREQYFYVTVCDKARRDRKLLIPDN